MAHPLSQQLLKMEWHKGDATYLSTANFNGWFYAFVRVSFIVSLAFYLKLLKFSVAKMNFFQLLLVPDWLITSHVT